MRGVPKPADIQQLQVADLQKWNMNTYSKTYADQYGFVIRYGYVYRLEHDDQFVVEVHSLSAAQLIAAIILNDLILNKKI